MMAILLVGIGVAVVVGWSEVPRRRSLGRFDDAAPTLTAWWASRGSAAAPDADARLLEGVARSLRSGSSLLDALAAGVERADGALASELRPVVVAARAGRPLGEELRRRLVVADDERRGALRLLHVAVDQGGSTAVAVDEVAALVRSDLALRADARVQSSQAMASAAVVSALPVGFLALSTLTTPSVPAFLLGAPLGWAVLGVGLTLDAAGLLWMRRLVAGVVS